MSLLHKLASYYYTVVVVYINTMKTKFRFKFLISGKLLNSIDTHINIETKIDVNLQIKFVYL